MCWGRLSVSNLEVGEFLHAVGTWKWCTAGGVAFVRLNLASHMMQFVLDDIDKHWVTDKVVVVTRRPRSLRICLHPHPRTHKLHTHRDTLHTQRHRHLDTHHYLYCLYVVTVTTKYSNQYEAQRVQTQRNQSSRTVLTADTHSTTPACSFTDSWGFSYITSHHIEKTDAGLDRPLYLRNKLYDKTLKSQNYSSNILRFPVPGDLPYGNTIPLVSPKLI